MTKEGRAGLPPEFPLPPEQKKLGSGPWVVGGLLALIAVVFVGCQFGQADEGKQITEAGTTAETEQAKAYEAATNAVASVIAEREDPAIPIRWHYQSYRDPMTDRTTQTACTTSTNSAAQEPPYSTVSADLCVQQSAQTGLGAYIVLNGDGQILCRRYNNCTVRVRFGDGEQQSFSAAEAADGSSNMIFILNASRLVTAIKQANVTRVQFTLYRAGSPVLEFPTAGLELPRG